MIEAIIFDLDGLLVDSEPVWGRARVDLAARHGREWTAADQLGVAGVHTAVWVERMRMALGGTLSAGEVHEEIVGRMEAWYLAARIPVLPGASEALAACSERYRLGLASGSPRRLIEACLEGNGWRERFESVISSDELERGKPAPDVYLAILERMGVRAARAAVVEDSGAGIRAGRAANARVIAVPNPHTDPGPEVLALADVTIDSLFALPGALQALGDHLEDQSAGSAGGPLDRRR